MLQQTQVERVVPKYKAFLKRFPNIVSLSEAPLADVLALWSGLGYNRRALYVQRAAKAIVEEYGGTFPKDPEILEKLPGIGPYTARAIATFSYDAPYIFIETNIRRVYIHFFFAKASKNKPIHDKELMPIIERACPAKPGRSRDWYWALMDYGSRLGSTIQNPNRRSAHYTKQSTFKGSVRELRGAFLRACAEKPVPKKVLFSSSITNDRARAEQALSGLIKDGILDLDRRGYVRIKK